MNTISRKEYEESKARVKAYLDAAIEEDILSNAHTREPRKGVFSFLLGAIAAFLLAVFVFHPSRTVPEEPPVTSWTEVVAEYGEKKNGRASYFPGVKGPSQLPVLISVR